MPENLTYEQWVVEIERLRGELRKEIAVRDTLEAEHLVARTNATADINRRLHENNEFRAQLASERIDYLTRDMYEREYGPLMDRVIVVEKTYVTRDFYDAAHASVVNRISALELTASKISGTYWAMGAMISAVVGVVTLVAHLYFK